jgi:DNA helicase-2/ATP-dependent DNA helicase PcrA
LLPHDESALSKGIKRQDPAWDDWLSERNRLFLDEGRIAFDLFGPNAVALLEASEHLRWLAAARFPMLIVDEAQDTNADAWRCVELLASRCQVICLADLEQQIFDYLPGVGPERVAKIREVLQPFEIDLESENHRSPDGEILQFANDIVAGKSRGAPYRGVSRIAFNPKTMQQGTLLRRAVGTAYRVVRNETGAWPRSIAILAGTNAAAMRISQALSSAAKPIEHKLHFEHTETLLNARVVAFLLEPRIKGGRTEAVATALDLLAAAKRGVGSAEADKWSGWAVQLRDGKSPRAALVKAVADVVEQIESVPLAGRPAEDWTRVKAALRATGQSGLGVAVDSLNFLAAFRRGNRIAAGLAAEWARSGAYTGARDILETALAQEQLLDADEPRGVQVMTIHKSKSKQFDCVIIPREGRPGGGTMVSTFVWWQDVAPYPRSRRILRVAITRARKHTMILDPYWPKCPILDGHVL